jgi:hypothetical protein
MPPLFFMVWPYWIVGAPNPAPPAEVATILDSATYLIGNDSTTLLCPLLTHLSLADCIDTLEQSASRWWAIWGGEMLGKDLSKKMSSFWGIINGLDEWCECFINRPSYLPIPSYLPVVSNSSRTFVSHDPAWSQPPGFWDETLGLPSSEFRWRQGIFLKRPTFLYRFDAKQIVNLYW